MLPLATTPACARRVMPRPDRGHVSEGEHRAHAGRVRRRATLCCLSVPWTAPRTGTPRVPTSDGHLGRLPHGRPRAVGAGALSFTGSECHRRQYVEATPVCCEVLHYLGRALSSMVAVTGCLPVQTRTASTRVCTPQSGRASPWGLGSSLVIPSLLDFAGSRPRLFPPPFLGGGFPPRTFPLRGG